MWLGSGSAQGVPYPAQKGETRATIEAHLPGRTVGSVFLGSMLASAEAVGQFSSDAARQSSRRSTLSSESSYLRGWLRCPLARQPPLLTALFAVILVPVT